jgi:nitrate/nitrite transporter NarK
MLRLEFLCFKVVFTAFSTCHPTFLNTGSAFPLGSASFVSSIVTIVPIFSGPAGGHLSDRIGSRKILIAVPLILTALLFLVPFGITGWMIPAFTIAGGSSSAPSLRSASHRFRI